MARLWVLLAGFVLFSTSALAQSNVRPIYDNTPDGGSTTQPVDSGTHGLPVQIIGGSTPSAPVVVYQKNIGTTTYTKTTFALTGASQTLLAASTTRVGFVLYNPAANGSVWVGLDGGTVASETGVLVPAGGRFSITGSATPKTAVSVIGTNTQSLILEEGN